jgi:hypothetical protein
VRWVLLALAACGSQPAAAPIVVAKPAPKSAKTAPVSCGDVAVILRGPVDDDRNAGPMKEEAIAKACFHDHWERAVIDCVGSSKLPAPCLDKLAPEQRERYRERIAEWHESFPLEALGDDAPEETAEVDYVSCGDAVGDVSLYAPALALKGSDRELATTMRRNHVLALCDDWTTEVRKCFEQTGGASAAIASCRTQLEPDQEQELVDRLAEVDAVMTRILAVKKADCRKVVATHYADARWTGKLATLKAAERKKLIAASRAAMTKACVDEKWSPSLRACVVAQGGDACFSASGMTPATWGFPASVIPIKTGIPECDAYGDALRALVTCKAIPRQAAQSMLDSFQLAAPIYLNMGPAERGPAARSCVQADSAIRQSAKSLGCTI